MKRVQEELDKICPKPTKQVLKIYEGLFKAAITLIVQMRTEKIGLKKFLHSRKILGFDLPECLSIRGVQSAKHFLIECRMYMEKKNKIWEENRRRAEFGIISWEKMLTCPRFAQKTVLFMKLFELIDQFRSKIFD